MNARRSEGEAERDIGSPGMMGPGLVVVENSSVVVAAVAAIPQVLVHRRLVHHWLVHTPKVSLYIKYRKNIKKGACRMALWS